MSCGLRGDSAPARAEGLAVRRRRARAAELGGEDREQGPVASARAADQRHGDARPSRGPRASMASTISSALRTRERRAAGGARALAEAGVQDAEERMEARGRGHQGGRVAVEEVLAHGDGGSAPGDGAHPDRRGRMPSPGRPKTSTNLRSTSRCRVSKTSELFPDPETPVTTVSPSPKSTSTSLRLFSAAPRTSMSTPPRPPRSPRGPARSGTGPARPRPGSATAGSARPPSSRRRRAW